MKKVVIGIVILAVVVLLMFIFIDKVNLGPKSPSKKSASFETKTNPSPNSFVVSGPDSISVHEFVSMVDATTDTIDKYDSPNIPASGLFLMTYKKVDTSSQKKFYNSITQKKKNIERGFL